MKNDNLYGEQELYQRIAKGEEKAFREVHHAYKARLLYYGNRLTGDWSEAEDIVADAFVSLWQHRQQIQSEKHIENFLFLAIRNRASDFTSKQARRVQLLDEMPLSIDVEEDLYDLKLMEEQMQFLLHQAVASLPTECARIFELSWRNEKSPAEIGRILDMNPATVRSQKRRAIQLIQAWIQKNAPKVLLLGSIFFSSYYFIRKFLLIFLHDGHTHS